MFVRMLKLPDDQRLGHDLSSHRLAIHAAAPCPVDVKRAMIDWWGPILQEYYAATEGNGVTFIDSGAVAEEAGLGRPAGLGTLHVCAEDGTELAAGDIGLVYFERETVPFTYHNDPAKTRRGAAPGPPRPGPPPATSATSTTTATCS